MTPTTNCTAGLGMYTGYRLCRQDPIALRLGATAPLVRAAVTPLLVPGP